MRVGLIRNLHSHAGFRRRSGRPPPDVSTHEVRTPADLDQALSSFSKADVAIIAIEGGDGTVRDVLTAARRCLADKPILYVLFAAGKTNVLARDLGRRQTWRRIWRAGRGRLIRHERRPLRVRWVNGEHDDVLGFILGAAAFTRATTLSRSANRIGAFQSAAVALTLLAAFVRTLFAPVTDDWRTGEALDVRLDGAPYPKGRRFLFLASTLNRLPLGLSPFGRPAEGIGFLDIDAPARRLAQMIGPVLSGDFNPDLEQLGYRRGRAERVWLRLASPFIIDGDVFPPGEVEISLDDPVTFLVG